MGACSASILRSDRMMMVHPSATAADAASQRASMALFSAPGPSAGLKTDERVTDLAYASSMARIFASSALVRTGRWSLSWRHCWGVSSNRLPSQPKNDSTEVTSSSRIASRGGLLTWAKSCLKYQNRSGGLVGEYGEGSVVAHRADRLCPILGHGGQDHARVLEGIAEGRLSLLQGTDVVTGNVVRGRQVVQRAGVFVEPLPVGALGAELRLDLLVRDKPSALGVEEEHAARAGCATCRRCPRPGYRARRSRRPLRAGRRV